MLFRSSSPSPVIHNTNKTAPIYILSPQKQPSNSSVSIAHMMSRLLIRKRVWMGFKRLPDRTNNSFHGMNVADRAQRRMLSSIFKSPKLLLSNHFQSCVASTAFSAAFSDSFIIQEGQMWWTSTFTDPLNNIVYDTMWLPEETFGKSLQHENGKIYFTRVKSAQHGASQKALERLRITPD